MCGFHAQAIQRKLTLNFDSLQYSYFSCELFDTNRGQTLVDKDNESRDSSVSSLSGQTDRQQIAFFLKSGQHFLQYYIKNGLFRV